MTTGTIQTAFADIAVWDSAGDGPPVLLLHGNSASKEIFRRQFEAELLSGPRLIALDLPGHGASSDALDPHVAYTMAGYAQMAVQVLEQLEIQSAAVFGWSLGGHIALDMIARYPGMRGVMICGTPPVPNGPDAILGFQPSEHMALTGKADWSADEAVAFARAGVGSREPLDPFILDAARRTHGLAREVMFTSAMSGAGADQRRIVEKAAIPLAIVNGADDPFINHGYFDTVTYANLWDGRVHRLTGLGHAPFWEAPDAFNPLFDRFIADTAPGG